MHKLFDGVINCSELRGFPRGVYLSAFCNLVCVFVFAVDDVIDNIIIEMR